MAINTQDLVVVLTANTTTRLNPDSQLQITGFPTPVGIADVKFYTEWLDEGTGHPVPRDLAMELHCRTTAGFDKAVGELASIAGGILAVVSFAANSPMEFPILRLAYDQSPDKTERRIRQRAISKVVPPLPGAIRSMPQLEVAELISAIGRHRDGQRLHRAITHYAEALRYWRAGLETYSVSHMWIAVEALTPVIIRIEQSKMGASSANDLANNWGINSKDLRSEIRRRTIFQNDADCYQWTKRASDAYEHSFEDLGDVQTMSQMARDRAARYIREAIIRASGVSESRARTLNAEPYLRPHQFIDYVTYVEGHIIGKGNQLAAPGRRHPELNVSARLELVEGSSDEETTEIEWKYTFGYTVEQVVANNLSIELDLVQVDYDLSITEMMQVSDEI